MLGGDNYRNIPIIIIISTDETRYLPGSMAMYVQYHAQLSTLSTATTQFLDCPACSSHYTQHARHQLQNEGHIPSRFVF
jgi:hypothetical protein